MCPACMTTVAIAAAGATSFTAVLGTVLHKLGLRRRRAAAPTPEKLSAVPPPVQP